MDQSEEFFSKLFSCKLEAKFQQIGSASEDFNFALYKMLVQSGIRLVRSSARRGTRAASSGVIWSDAVISGGQHTEQTIIGGIWGRLRSGINPLSYMRGLLGKPEEQETNFWRSMVNTSVASNANTGMLSDYAEAAANANSNASSAEAQVTTNVFDTHILQSSTVKKRRMAMNKHKLKKRRKVLRMNTKISRGAVRS